MWQTFTKRLQKKLCTCTKVNNYVSASTTHGIAIFRVKRNDEYIQLMLQILSRLENDLLGHAPTKIPRPYKSEDEFFRADPRCAQLRDLSIHLSNEVKIWRFILPGEVQRSDQPSNLWLK